MEKYGTYKIYKNIDSGEILRLLVDSAEFTKVASDESAWIELEEEEASDSEDLLSAK